MKDKKHYLLPFSLLAFVIIFDQITKLWALKNMEPYTIFTSFFGDFLNFRLVYNMGAAFSFGARFDGLARFVVLILLPLVFLIMLIVFYFKSDDFTKAQRWCLCGIMGGGFGNLIDRFFRSEGVVDFIDVKFYGIFGMERWPTFNIADASIVCCGIGLAITLLITSFKEKKAKPSEEK